MYDLVILGAGPAGLSAAIYAMRKRLDFLVISEDLGGKTNHVVNLPEVEDYTIIKAREQVSVYRSRLHYRSELYRKERVTKVISLTGPEAEKATLFEVCTQKTDGTIQTYQSRTVFIATGANFPPIDVPGFRRFWGRGLGGNIQSYNHAFWEKEVFLFSDATRGLWNALDLASFASKVYLALSEEGTYDLESLEQVRRTTNIYLCEDVRLVEFNGDDFCQSVEISCRGVSQVLKADGFFLDLEPQANLEFLSPNLGADFDDAGRIVVDKYMQTRVPGLFAGGDGCDAGRYQVLTALGQGAGAAMSIYQWLRHPAIIV
ncbi:MAG: NAD(P)/FAD-dependent oxidoreductase [Spirochaetales bacterium]|nr:NAD(P)/FAD-dependent oxidoreductase [Spirochaetales bacterium]